MKNWWSEIENNSVRDQLSFNYVCWKINIQYLSVHHSEAKKYFLVNAHRKDISYDIKQTKVLNFKIIFMKIFNRVYSFLKN